MSPYDIVCLFEVQGCVYILWINFNNITYTQTLCIIYGAGTLVKWQLHKLYSLFNNVEGFAHYLCEERAKDRCKIEWFKVNNQFFKRFNN